MRGYEKEFKKEAVKLAKEMGTNEAAKQLGVPKGNAVELEKVKKRS